jgi:hypothetical protein
VCAPATVTCTDWAGGELVRALLDGLAEGVTPPGAAVLLPLLLADGELPSVTPLLVPLPLLSLLLPPPLSRLIKAYVSPPSASASTITPAITAAAARRLRTGSVEVGVPLGGGYGV